MIVKVYAATVIGIKTHLVTVEVTLKKGRHAFHIVGMGDKAVQESRRRIVAALEHFGIDLMDVQITVNLAPANLKKVGSLFDFPIAVAILQHLKRLSLPRQFLEKTIIVGELSFDGEIRPIAGVMTMALDAPKLKIERIVMSLRNFADSSQIKNIECVGIDNLVEFNEFVNSDDWRQKPVAPPKLMKKIHSDFGAIKGQRQAKRMMQIAAAGNHNLIMVGPPGSGKTMMAQALPSIMPPLTSQEVMETTRVHAATLQYNSTIMRYRPFRNPHHGISQAGMIGGGSPLMPGEISLAHNGILFLDELTEFKRSVIEALRQPLEDRKVSICRANASIVLPCSFIMIAALNPCPCGNLGNLRRSCSCTALSIYSYLKKISGPFLDRIDLQLFLQNVDLSELQEKKQEWDSAFLYKKIERARSIQKERYVSSEKYNGQLTPAGIDKHCKLSESSRKLLDFCFEKFQMSMRSYHKIIKVSRTIADLSGEKDISEIHLKEALMYRGIEQKLTMLKNRI
jgi:magnesium chelatase family protein